MKNFITTIMLTVSVIIIAQTGHIMQGVGAVNMSMGGAATAQPLDISGALQWNPASISAFDSKTLNVDLGVFFASPELTSTIEASSSPLGVALSGTTKDEKGMSPMPAIAYVWAKPESKHTFGISAFGVSGFGVDFPAETNLPMDANGNMNFNFNPNSSNAITYPQSFGGFGNIKSNYMMMQIGLTWAYKINKNFSVGIQPNFDYSMLEIAPNPTSSPSQTKGYPNASNTSSMGYGAQAGIFYDSKNGVKLGIAYKTQQYMKEFDFINTYIDGSDADNNKFTMNYPAILSLGFGYSKGNFDFAADFRNVYYANTEGFSTTGWTETGAVKGFGWENMAIFSTGLQYKGIKKFPVRIGFTTNTNPVNEEVAFYSVSAPAVIKNAYQVGLGFVPNDKLKVNALYHHGSSCGQTSSKMLNPQMIPYFPPYGAVPGTNVSYSMKTDLMMLGVSYKFGK